MSEKVCIFPNLASCIIANLSNTFIFISEESTLVIFSIWIYTKLYEELEWKSPMNAFRKCSFKYQKHLITPKYGNTTMNFSCYPLFYLVVYIKNKKNSCTMTQRHANVAFIILIRTTYCFLHFSRGSQCLF